jgi:hypothetical protein
VKLKVEEAAPARQNLVSPWITALGLFVIALLPRLPGLDLFLTSDENTNIFYAGSEVIVAFLRGDLPGTYWHFYPGVTMSWLDAIGMASQYGLAALSGASLPSFTEYVFGDILTLVVANRLPYAILTGLAVPAVYLLARKLLPGQMALLGSLLLAFDPFFLGHSRIAHGDAPLAVFMTLSALSFFVYLQQTVLKQTQMEGSGGGKPAIWKWNRARYLVVSAVFGGLAALTKAPGPFMALFVTGLTILYAVMEIYRLSPRLGKAVESSASPSLLNFHASRLTPDTSRLVNRWLVVIIVWAAVSLAVFVLLWPAMWVEPVATVRRMWTETFGKVDEGHLVYFFGRPLLDPGPWFYPYVIPFRLTPVTLLGGALSVLWLLLSLRRPVDDVSFQSGARLSRFGNPLFLLWLFTLSLLLFGMLSPKKQDRYLLPLFPFLDLLAAIGWLGLAWLGWHGVRQKQNLLSSAAGPLPTALATTIVLILAAGQLAPVLTYYPYYLAYFNPLMGGPVRAARTTLMGWGEGMEQVAAYLNTKPDAEKLYVASTPSQTLLPYFAGTGENFYTNDVALRADYVVLYLAQMQRLAPSPEIVRYFEAQQPEKVITIKGVPYAKIYPGPKLILADIPPGVTPANVGLNEIIRLAGYRLVDFTPPDIDLSLYWHALAPLSVNYTVSVRAQNKAGQMLAQQDNWPAGGLLPTSQWRQGDYVIDTHRLEVGEGNEVSSFEIVVYNAETGETLGPPIVLPVRDEQLTVRND